MPAGIYIHIPFCKSRCSYCDFATDVYRDSASVGRYVNALCAEIRNFKFGIGTNADTIYFGGGTPSLLAPNHLGQVLDAVYKVFDVAPDAEVTMEMNPATVSPASLSAYRQSGVNRASFGVQTFNDRHLKLLARGHDADDARKTFRMLRDAGFENVSFDLIAGLPGQSMSDWRRNLEQAVRLNPEHISLYLLEIHEGTPLAEQVRSGRRPAPDEELAAEMYETLTDVLAGAGYEQYEISNFSKPGFESRHNTKYWRMEPVFGFGVSAHSFDGGSRYSNDRDTNRYVSLLEKGKSAVVENIELNKKQLSAEFAFLNLRLSNGLDLREYHSRFDIDMRREYAGDFRRLEQEDLIFFTDHRLRLTKKGMLFSNEVFTIFI